MGWWVGVCVYGWLGETDVLPVRVVRGWHKSHELGHKAHELFVQESECECECECAGQAFAPVEAVPGQRAFSK